MAPEVVSKGNGYSKPSDWWSFGVFTYDLLTGRSPFYSNRGKAETKNRILHGKLILPIYVTRDAQDLIKKLLRRPVARRLGTTEDAVEIKSHVFFKEINWDDVANKRLKPPFVPSVSSQDDVSHFDLRFTSKAISRESDERSDVATKENGNEEEKEEVCLFPDFDYISPEMLTRHLEDKILNLQDMRIRGYGNP
jgi:p70 ribosomal S6 kinase